MATVITELLAYTERTNKTGRETTHRVGNVAWQFHNIILSSHHIKSYEGLCVWIDNAKVLVDDFNGYVESEGLDPDNLDSADPRLPKLYFEIEPDQARRLGEALIAHADYASTGETASEEDGE